MRFLTTNHTCGLRLQKYAFFLIQPKLFSGMRCLGETGVHQKRLRKWDFALAGPIAKVGYPRYFSMMLTCLGVSRFCERR